MTSRLGRNAITATLGLTGLVAFVGCGNGSTTPTSTAKATVTATVTQTVTAAADSDGGTSASASPTATVRNGVGKPFKNKGVTVVVQSVTTSKSAQFGDRSRKAGAGAKFVFVKAKVTNNAKSGMDLTCAYPIDNHLVDDQDRQFDSVNFDLYDLPGNPECNALLQPGFSDMMTWLYRTPANANITSWVFGDLSDPNSVDASSSTIPLVH